MINALSFNARKNESKISKNLNFKEMIFKIIHFFWKQYTVTRYKIELSLKKDYVQ